MLRKHLERLKKQNKTSDYTPEFAIKFIDDGDLDCEDLFYLLPEGCLLTDRTSLNLNRQLLTHPENEKITIWFKNNIEDIFRFIKLLNNKEKACFFEYLNRMYFLEKFDPEVLIFIILPEIIDEEFSNQISLKKNLKLLNGKIKIFKKTDNFTLITFESIRNISATDFFLKYSIFYKYNENFILEWIENILKYQNIIKEEVKMRLQCFVNNIKNDDIKNKLKNKLFL